MTHIGDARQTDVILGSAFGPAALSDWPRQRSERVPSVARRTGLAKIIDGRAEGCLVTNPANLRYLSGFTGSNGALLVRSDGSAVLATDGRYAEQAAGESPGV